MKQICAIHLTAFSVSSYFLFCYAASLSCSDETDSVDKVWETSHLQVKSPSLVLLDYYKPVSFQEWSVLFWDLSWSETRVLEKYRLARV